MFKFRHSRWFVHQPGRSRGDLLQQRIKRLGRRLVASRQTGGYSLLVLLLLVLTVLTTTLALTSRTTGGLHAQSYQTKLRLAKDAAENGLTVVASELNYPGNRTIMGGGETNYVFKFQGNPGLDYVDIALEYGSLAIPGGSGNDQVSLSDKPAYIFKFGGFISDGNSGHEGANNNIYLPSHLYGDFYTTWFQNIAKQNNSSFCYLGNNQFYRVIDLRLYNSDHSDSNRGSYVNAAPDDISYLAVVVEGLYSPTLGKQKSVGDIIDSTSVNSVSDVVKIVIQQEFQVVPRCASMGFGFVGTVSYGPSTSNSDACNVKTPTEWIVRSVSRTSAFNTVP